jgi:hypothetical protein
LSGKGDVHADEEPKKKRKSKLVILLEKVEVFYYVDRGMSNAAVRYYRVVNELMIPFMKKNECDQGK